MIRGKFGSRLGVLLVNVNGRKSLERGRTLREEEEEDSESEEESLSQRAASVRKEKVDDARLTASKKDKFRF